MELDRSIEMYVERYADGLASPLHSHDEGQFLYAVGGYLTLRTAAGFFIVPNGYALLIEPGLPHVGASVGEVELRTVYLEPAAWPSVTFAPTRVIRVSPLLAAAVEAFAREARPYDGAGRAGHLAALIVDEIAQATEQPLALPLPVHPKLRELCDRLERQPQTDLTLDLWADRLGFSRRTLTRRFREETGMSFVQWRRRLRGIHALRRTAEGASLKEIAAEVGYRNPTSLRVALSAG